MFKEYLDESLPYDPHFLDPLIGKDLACWCPLNQPCHADLLLKRLSSLPPMPEGIGFQLTITKKVDVPALKGQAPSIGGQGKA
jgi:hypothetical protein